MAPGDLKDLVADVFTGVLAALVGGCSVIDLIRNWLQHRAAVARRHNLRGGDFEEVLPYLWTKPLKRIEAGWFLDEVSVERRMIELDNARIGCLKPWGVRV